MGAADGTLAFFGAGDLESRMRSFAFGIQLSTQDPWSLEWVMDQVRACPPKHDLCEVGAVFNALKYPNMRYAFHPRGMDRVQTLKRTVELRTYDCDQACVAICTAFHLLGFATGARIMSATGSSWDHIWPIVGLPRNDPPDDTRLWMPLELTTGPDGTQGSARLGWQIPQNVMPVWRDYKFVLT